MASLKVTMLCTATDVTVAARGLSVCMSVTCPHPAKATGQNKMPFSRNTAVVPSNIVLDRDPSPATGRGDGRNPDDI